MNRFTKYLTDLLPRTGRMITERGTMRCSCGELDRLIS